MDHIGIWCEDMDRIKVPQHMMQWRTLVNTVMKLRIP